MRRTLVTYSIAISFTLITIAAFAPSAFAAKTCYDCHTKEKEIYSKVKFAHQPVKDENCESCHKRHGFAQKLILQDATSELCYKCHADLKEKYSQGSVHFPVASGKCWDCHDPHGSNEAAMLWEPSPDTPVEHFCLMCHQDNMDAARQKEFIHAPYDGLECLTCHAAHNSSNPGLLVADIFAVCGSCHDQSDETWAAVHKERNAGGLPCSDCHDAHASNGEGLLNDDAHAPFAGGDCEICHSLPDANGKVAFEEGASPGGLCAACHDDIIENLSKSHPHPAVEADNCDNCHSPHSSRFGSLLRDSQGAICGECHDGVLTGEGQKPHMPVVTGDCSGCHEVHGSDNAALVKADDATLCLGCHKDFAQSRDAAANVHAALDDCLGCHKPHEGIAEKLLRAPVVELCAGCHEPDREALNAASGHQPYMTGECSDCHLPHFSDTPHLVRGEGAAPCLVCHVDIEKRLSMDVPHAPAVDECQGCHVPHYSKDNLHLLSARPNELCSSCHDYESLDLQKEFVHTPAAQGDCAGCHNPHGGNQPKLVTGRMTKVDVGGLMVGQLPKLSGISADLCYTCHDDLKEEFRRQNAHAPVAQGECDACHAAHGSDNVGFVVAAAPDLCVTCHDVDDALTTAHDGYDITTADCLECHNPHISDQPKLVRNTLHPPFADNDCGSCHEIGPDGKAVLIASAIELCSACHETVTESAELEHQHAPFAGEECGACHSLHAADYAGLLRFEGSSLCMTCHENIKDQQQLSVSHRPFEEGQCLECHRPHASAYPGLTTKPAESFCVSCHEDINRQITEGAPHAPVADGDCGACHVPHAGNQSALLTTSKVELCGQCHDLTDRDLRTAHKGFSLEGVDCQNCHAAHAGPAGSKGLLLPDVHVPFADGDCTSCHDGMKAHQLIAPVNRVCFACHEDFLESTANAVVHAPLQREDGCVECHGPHVGYGSKLLLKEGISLCLSCHDDNEFKGKNKHAVAFEDCGNCHQPHTSANSGLLATADIMELCLTCHEGAVETHYHPMGVGVTDPRTKEPLNCVGCHSPHSSDYTAILVAEKDRKLCIICHTVSR
ncbi:MAG: cytochrome c3 family protein [Candidatus Zixiibacteriota bacterium]